MTLKYIICWYFERLHRYVFDHLYFCYDDPKYKPLNLKNKMILGCYKNTDKLIYKDWREYLNYWHSSQKNKYVRYKKYLQ